MALQQVLDAKQFNTNLVSSPRYELIEIMPQYELIRDVLAGEATIKRRKTKYLPQPNPEDTSEKNLLRYNDYLIRAMFYNVTARTVQGLVGQIFLRKPVSDFPANLKILETNSDGKGLTIAQLAKQACGHALAYGRCGLLSDFPRLNGTASVAEIEEKGIQPTIKFYAPWDIINWETQFRNGKTILTMVVLRETFEEREPGQFNVEVYEQFRALDLDNGVCRVRVFKVSDEEEISEESILKDSNGRPLTFIPFEFIGAENNDVCIDSPPVYDLAVLNIAHYRNSADYEESVYMLGQPTPVFTGVTEQWVNEVLKGKIYLGSRGSVPLPPDADAKLLQVEPNTLAMEAMAHKEKQMIGLGAKLIEQRKIEQTATEVEVNNASENSILSNIANNVELAIIKSLKNCQVFVGEESAEIKFELNTNFDLTSLTAEEIRFLLETWKGGGISFPELRQNLLRSGIATETNNEKAKSDILADLDLRKKVFEVENPPQPKPIPTTKG